MLLWRRTPAIVGMVALAIVVSTLATWFLKPSPAPRLRTFTLPLKAFVGPVNGPVLSPDGTMVAYVQGAPPTTTLWIHDLASGTSRELPGTTGAERPFWSPDSRAVGYVENPVSRPALRTVAVQGGPSTSVCALPLAGARTPVRLTKTLFREIWQVLSPDERYVAYMSSETGRDEVYVTTFPSGAGKWLVSVNGGTTPRWSPTGAELFYVEGTRLMAVPVRTSPSFEVLGTPQPLFAADQVTPPLRLAGRSYDVARDGRRFVVVQQVAAGAPGRPTITVVQDWAAGLKKTGKSEE